VRALLQRVTRASVRVDGAQIAAIDGGLLVLLGVGHGDDDATADALARRVCELRIFEDDDGKTNRSLVDVGGACLVVSQFTLYADTRKGRRPSWDAAAPGEVAEPLVEALVGELRRRGCTVATGSFGARMQVSSVNEGPMTLLLEV
jgi:D-aminoacyl-tRNA deacylase